MIKLTIESYCENCKSFKPKTEKIMVGDFYGKITYDTEVTCKNKKKCERIRDYLKKTLKTSGTEKPRYVKRGNEHGRQ